MQFLHREEFLGGTRHDKGKRIGGADGGEASEDFVAAFVGEEEFPAKAVRNDR